MYVSIASAMSKETIFWMLAKARRDLRRLAELGERVLEDELQVLAVRAEVPLGRRPMRSCAAPTRRRSST